MGRFHSLQWELLGRPGVLHADLGRAKVLDQSGTQEDP